jgi:hypothetical protein
MVPQPVITPSPGNTWVFHAEIGAAMGLVHVVFLERSLVEKHFEPFARGQLALGVLRVDALLAAAKPRLFAPLLNLFDNLPHHRPPFFAIIAHVAGNTAAAKAALVASPRMNGVRPQARIGWSHPNSAPSHSTPGT